MPKIRRLPLGKRYTAITLLLVVLGVVITWAGRLTADSWGQGALVNIGTTLLLFSPLLLLGRGVERRLNRVEESQEHIETTQQKTAQEVATLATEVTHAVEELKDVRQELAAAVTERLAQNRREDFELFRAVAEQPSRSVIARALERADTLGLISARGPRVQLAGTRVYVRFVLAGRSPRGGSESCLEVVLEFKDGNPVDNYPLDWTEGEGNEYTPAAVLVYLTERVQAAGEYPGDAVYEPARVFDDLSAMLDLAYTRSTGAGGVTAPIGRIVQLFLPQWAITDNALTSIDEVPYVIGLERLREIDWELQVTNKGWVDLDSFEAAFGTATDMYNACNLAIKPPEYVEEVPF